MKVVITGGAGFIGLKLARKLLERNHDVTAIDVLTPQVHGCLPSLTLPEGLVLVRASLDDIDSYQELFESADAIYHLAAETGTGQSMYQIGQYVKVNELGTAQVLEAIARCKSRPRYIFLASSRSVYGEGAYRNPQCPEKIIQPNPRSSETLSQGLWEPTDNCGADIEPIATPESLPYFPGSVYAATKAAQELLLLSASQGLNAKTIIFRFQNVYGEGQSLRNPYTGIISIFFNKARQGLEIPIYEDGAATRDFIHVEDIAGALTDALEANLSHGAIINLGAGHPTKIIDLASILSQEAGFDVPIRVTGQYRVGDIRNNWSDTTQAKKLLNFAPEISLPEGLRRFVLWAKNEPVYEDLSLQATKELQAKGLSN